MSSLPVIVLGNSSKRFSGVTSTMLQVLKHQKELAQVYVLGKHFVPDDIEVINFSKLRQLCNRDDKVVFHARRNNEMIQALVAKKLLGAKLKIVFTSTAQRYHTGFTKWLMKQADSVISTCQAAAKYVTAVNVDAIIPHGVDLNEFHRLEEKSESFKDVANEYGLTTKFGIGVFGRIRYSKGIDTVIEAAKAVLPQHPDWSLILSGECLAKDFDFQEELCRQIESAHLTDRIKFIGKQPFSKLPRLFSSLHLVIAASRNEGFGLTPLEAMASGTAVLTSQAGAWEEIVQDHFGRIFTTGDAVDLGRKLDHFLSSPETCSKMGIAAAKHAEAHYNSKDEAKRLTEHLLRVANS